MNLFNNKMKSEQDVEGLVIKTYDYNRFKFYDWNRDVSEKGLNRLAASVEKYGWRNDPIIIDEDFGVIDGQHRLVYARKHKLPVYYTIQKDITPLDCQRINSDRRAWTLADYIKYHAFRGNEDYQQIYKLIQRYPDMPVHTIVYACSGRMNISCAGGNSTRKIRAGELTIRTNVALATKLLDYLQELVPYIKEVGGRVDVLGRAIIYACQVEGVEKERLKAAVKMNCHSMTPAANLEVALKELERIYNQNKKKNRIYLWTEYQKDVYENSKANVIKMNEKYKNSHK